ncbi:flagellar biosynthetic protein FliP, partial [Campylobacter jejuni]
MKKILLFLLLSMSLFAAEATIPTVNLSLSAPNTPNQLVTTLNIVIVLTILALA